MENIFLRLRFNTGRNPSKMDYEIRQKIENSRRNRSINSIHGRKNNNDTFNSQTSSDVISVFDRSSQRTEYSTENSTRIDDTSDSLTNYESQDNVTQSIIIDSILSSRDNSSFEGSKVRTLNLEIIF
jgi:hypothetical protein